MGEVWDKKWHHTRGSIRGGSGAGGLCSGRLTGHRGSCSSRLGCLRGLLVLLATEEPLESLLHLLKRVRGWGMLVLRFWCEMPKYKVDPLYMAAETLTNTRHFDQRV